MASTAATNFQRGSGHLLDFHKPEPKHNAVWEKLAIVPAAVC